MYFLPPSLFSGATGGSPFVDRVNLEAPVQSGRRDPGVPGGWIEEIEAFGIRTAEGAI